MKKKIWVICLSALMIFSLLPAALAENNVDLSAQSGRLLISEAGVYTLTGSLRGGVWVDPGEGDVTLILDGISIDGNGGPGVAAVSGNSLTVVLADQSENTVYGGEPIHGGAIYCAVPARFEGTGHISVRSSNGAGIRGGGDLTFVSGSYAIQAPGDAVKADGRLTVLNASISDFNQRQTASAAVPAVAEAKGDAGSLMVVQTGNSGKLNLRQEPRKSAALIEQYPNGTQVTVLESQGEWSQVEVNGVTGYMMSQFLASPQQPTIEAATPWAQQPAVTAQTAFAPDNQETARTPDDNPPQLTFAGNDQRQSGRSNPPAGMAQPGPFVQTDTADSPSEVVYSTAENGALSLEADMDSAQTIVMSDDNSQVKIADSGTYVVTGASSDGNITVKKGAAGVVLVLDDLDLTSTTGATVAVNKEAQVKIIISGNVTLTDAENPDDENSQDASVADAYDGAAMKFKANSQVVLAGDGTLTINGNAKNGIKTGDDSSLIIDGGVTVNITAVNDGINSNYDVTLLNGEFTIAAGDDAIHADHILTVGSQDGNGPTLRVIGCKEGLEGTVVNVLGGNISVNSTDDAINAANGDGLYEGTLAYSFNMTGGQVTIHSQGDGIDSNGNVNLIGGSAVISSASMGGEAGIDYDGQYYVSGAFQLNNGSGVAGPDNMPGAMNGQMGDFAHGNAPMDMAANRNEANQETGSQTPSFPGGLPALAQNQPFGGTANGNDRQPASGPDRSLDGGWPDRDARDQRGGETAAE